MLAQALEAAMLIYFVISWPVNARKAWKAGTAAGTSAMFLGLITLGYLCGIAAKFAGAGISWVLAVYVFNLMALVANWAVYLRNRRLDARRRAQIAR